MTHVLVNAINDNAVPRGPDRYLLELLPAMLAADAGLQVTLAHAPWQAAMAQDMGPRVRHLRLDPPRGPVARLIWQAVQFPRVANGLGADVVWLPNLIWTPGLKAPSVMTAHDLLHFRYPEKFGVVKAWLLRGVIRRALQRSDAVIAVSAFTAGDVVRFGGVEAARVVTILEGGPLREERTQGPERFFLFVGKLERTKGICALIAAFGASEALARAGFRLLIVGPDGNAAGDVRAAMAGAGDSVQRLGFVDEAALRGLYLTCRGFVFPSVAEGFGLVVLEAMARGAPVIAAEATSLPEVVGDAGILVPPGDIPALTAALERLAFDDALFGQLQAAGYARLGEFDWGRAGRATAAVLSGVVR